MNGRLKIFLLINFLLLVLWIGYLFNVQVFDPYKLHQTIEIRKNPSKELIIPKRGNIYDRNLDLLVGTTKFYQLDLDRKIALADQKEDKKVEETLEKISEIISHNSELSKAEVKRIISQKPLTNSVYISDKISELQLQKIKKHFEKEKFSGLISNFSKMERTYPHGKLGANFLGIVEEKNPHRSISDENIYQVQGLCGVEASYDKELTGNIGWKETIQDANNKRIPFLFLRSKKAKKGNSLVLTIDNTIQEVLENRLRGGIQKYDAKNAIGIIMDPYTGKIIAMAGLERDKLTASAKVLRSSANLPVSFMFEPGSTLKPITALIALEKDIFAPEDKINCNDYHITFGEEERVIKDDHKFEILSFHDIVAHSSNVGISKIVEKIGSKSLFDRLIALGFRHRIGHRIFGESTGIFRKLNDWRGFSLHSISFGQEISVTALQLANAYCTLANGGKVMQPYFVEKVIEENGETIEQHEPRILREISDQNSLNTIKTFLQSVVEYGTATGTKLNFMDIAGKTGTAEKAIAGEFGYSEEKYTSVFAGFFPVEKPKYVMVIVYDEADYSSYSYYASLSAVPTFKEITTDLCNLPSSNLISEFVEAKTEYAEVPDLMNKHKNEALKILAKKELKYKIKRNGSSQIVTNQFPKPGYSFDQSKNIILVLGKEEKKEIEIYENRMPDLTGLTLRRALQKAHQSEVQLQIEGNGIVISQSIKPGSKIKYGAICKINADL